MRRFQSLFLILLLSVPAFPQEEKAWQTTRTPHFAIYSREVPPDFIRTVEAAAEEYYDEIVRNMGFRRLKRQDGNGPVRIYIYPGREEFLAEAKESVWAQGAANALKNQITTYPAASGFFDSTLPHELGHIIFRDCVGGHTDIPLWLDEGVAMYQEKAKRWGAHQAVRQAMAQNKFISLDELSRVRLYNSTPKEFVDLFYAEAASIVHYLIKEQGEYRFVDLCRRLKDGEPFNQAFGASYRRFKGLADLNRAWVKYLEAQ